MRSLMLVKVVTLVVLMACGPLCPAVAGDPSRPKMLIGFTSFRDDIRYANVFRYELPASSAADSEDNPDGGGRVTGKVAPAGKRSDHHPALSADGTMAVYAGEVVGEVNQIRGWDFESKQALDWPGLNSTKLTQMAPAFCSPLNLIAFEAWNRPGGAGRWDVLLYDVKQEKMIVPNGLNTPGFDERKPSFSPDGNWIAFTTNEFTEQSLTDVALFDRRGRQRVEVPGLNSESMDTEPSLSSDANWIAFVSDRPGGQGGRDIYLYNRLEDRLEPLPGLNSAGHEQSPAVSGDGRFIAFVSERLEGVGERDIFLYDRQSQSLVETPDLNSPGDEYDPHLVIVEDAQPR